MTDFTKVQANLEARGYTVHTFAAAAEAAAYLDGAIDGKTVGFGGSVTLQELGLYDAAGGPQHGHLALEAERTAGPEGGHAGARCTCTSANGLAETGEIVNIDGAGNRVAATLYRP